MRVVVTGAAGMIGSNLVRGLNAVGVDDIIAVDDLTEAGKFQNLLGATISDYFDRAEFYARFERAEFGRVDVVFHQGACSDTMQHDGRFMLNNNYRNSKALLDACQAQRSRMLYASSAAVYGAGRTFREQSNCERPLNVYGYSKLLFDQVVRRLLPQASAQIVGMRYFNVYGPREQHKARMASVAFHHFNEFLESGYVQLFGAYGGYAAGEQMRDFVYVGDVVAVNLWFLDHPDQSGIFNVGSGRAQPFNDVARAVVNTVEARRGGEPLSLAELISRRLVRYISFPQELVGKYQCHTQSDLTALRATGCDLEFADVDSGVRQYAEWLSDSAGVDFTRRAAN